MPGTLIGQLFEHIDARSWDALPRFFAEDVVYERPGYAPIVGLPQLLHFYRDVRVIIAGTHHVHRIVTDVTHGACWGRFVGQHKDGSNIDERFADVYEFDNGKIRVRCTYFFRAAV